MNFFITYFEKLLNALGLKKFMWLHAMGFIGLALMMLVGLVEELVKGTFKSSEAMIVLGGLTLAYTMIRAFQAVVERKVTEDRYMFFWRGNKKSKKD